MGTLGVLRPSTSASKIHANLRSTIDRLEETQRRFSRTISISEAIDSWLPHGGLPLGCIHEVKGISLANAITFASLLSGRIPQKRSIVYTALNRSFYPIGLQPFGLQPAQIIHVLAKRPDDLAWIVLEALRCPEVGAVMAVMDAKDLTVCRRLQLAAEGSGATGFLLGTTTSSQIAAPITRWRIAPVTGSARSGFAHASWMIDLLYCRGGRPGKWIGNWRDQVLEALEASSLASFKPVQSVAIAKPKVSAG